MTAVEVFDRLIVAALTLQNKSSGPFGSNQEDYAKLEVLISHLRKLKQQAMLAPERRKLSVLRSSWTAVEPWCDHPDFKPAFSQGADALRELFLPHSSPKNRQL